MPVLRTSPAPLRSLLRWVVRRRPHSHLLPIRQLKTQEPTVPTARKVESLGSSSRTAGMLQETRAAHNRCSFLSRYMPRLIRLFRGTVRVRLCLTLHNFEDMVVGLGDMMRHSLGGWLMFSRKLHQVHRWWICALNAQAPTFSQGQEKFGFFHKPV